MRKYADDNHRHPMHGRERDLKVRVCGAAASGLTAAARDCEGAIAAEFAILLLPLLLLLLGTVDIGFALLTETLISFAVEAAAKCGAVNTGICDSPTEIATYGASVAGCQASTHQDLA